MKSLQSVTHIALSLCFPLKFSSYPSNRLVWNTLDFYVHQLLSWSQTVPQREHCLIGYFKSPTLSLTSVCEHSSFHNVRGISFLAEEMLAFFREGSAAWRENVKKYELLVTV
jgi:hypothetical protein